MPHATDYRAKVALVTGANGIIETVDIAGLIDPSDATIAVETGGSISKERAHVKNTVKGNLESRKDGFLGIWSDLISEPVWKYQELPPFLLAELTKLDLLEASESELSRAMWFWLRRPKFTPHESATLIVWTLCVLLGLTIALLDWPFTSMPERAAELFLLLFEVAVAIWAIACRLRFLRWRREYELSLDRLIRTIHPAL